MEENGTSKETEEIDAKSAIESLSQALLLKRDEAIEFRAASGIERMWRDDDDAFDGGDIGANRSSMIDYATGEAYYGQGDRRRSEVVVNIIRGKCETAEGRFSDIMLPVDDRNWALEVTPVPEISKALKDDRIAALKGAQTPLIEKGTGQEMKVSDVAKSDLDKIKAKMALMETEIDDQLTECKYNAETRKLICSSARTGTGIIKGPNVVKRLSKVWVPNTEGEKEVHTLDMAENFEPASIEVSCWDIYPDPDVEEDISKAAYIWESDNIRPKELRDLYGVPGYINDEIIKILQEEPVRVRTGYDGKERKHKVQKTTASMGELYEKWTYTGDINRADLEAMGVSLIHDELSQSFSGCVVFINDRPVKVELNALDTGDLPYDFFQWTIVKGSPWGIGIPRMMSWLQRILNAAWRAMMDNAGDSAGANVVIGPGIEPVDNNWELTGKKLWRLLEEYAEDGDVRKSFQQFQVANNQKDLESIIELVLKFVDLETSIPTIFQGEQQKTPETLGATNIMVDAANVGLRNRVKRFDDQITVQHLKRYYDWNMQYNENQEIKGDYNVNPRGTSALVKKDQQAKMLMQVMALKADPDASMRIDWDKAFSQMFKSMDLDILKSDEEYKRDKEALKKNPPKQDPRIVSAQMKSQTDLKKAELVQASDMQEIKTKGAMSERDLGFKAQEAEKGRMHDRAMKEMELQVKIMEFAEKRNINLDKVKADLAGTSMKLKTQISLAGPDKEGPQVSTPLVEPQGRAKDGRAYQD